MLCALLHSLPPVNFSLTQVGQKNPTHNNIRYNIYILKSALCGYVDIFWQDKNKITTDTLFHRGERVRERGSTQKEE